MKNDSVYTKFQKLPQKYKAKLNELTYRQYLALSYIVSKLKITNEYPSKEELKKVIGFDTDRMLYITLSALKKKGFIDFLDLNSVPFVKLSETTKHLEEILEDKLLLIQEYASYQEIRNKLRNISIEEKLTYYQTPLLSGSDIIKYLNNELKAVHRWYEYLEDFPPSLVWKYFDTFKVSKNQIILDPFVGSGTTCVVAKFRGLYSIGVDINPVAFFVTKVKTSFDEVELTTFKTEAETILNEVLQLHTFVENCRLPSRFLDKMPKMERNQWLKPIVQNYVAYVRERVNEIENTKVRELLELALVEASLESSNVAFCPGTTFYPFRQKPTFPEALKSKLQKMYEDLSLINQANVDLGKTAVHLNDSKEMSKFLENNSIDFVFTSPPYPNDLEYTRQTKLELYLLGFVKSEREIQQIKRKMVKGSTKLIYNESNSSKYVEKYESIQRIVSKLEEAFADREWGWDYPRMVAEYFGDLYIVFSELNQVLKRNGVACFVVGDQTYKGILIPVGRILTEIAIDLGFEAKLDLFRIRRSTSHNLPLREEIVIMKKVTE